MQKTPFEDDLLSPDDAAQLLNSGESASKAIFARLDVDACHFSPRVDDQGTPPLITTSFKSFTNPSAGLLAFSSEAVAEQQAMGNRSILVVGLGLLIADMTSQRKPLSRPDGLIIVCPPDDDKHHAFFDHFIMKAFYYRSALIDNPLKPQISCCEKSPQVTLGDGSLLREGDEITIDPMTGRLWRGQLNILNSESSLTPFLNTDRYSESMKNPANIAFHVPQRFDFEVVYKLKNNWDLKINVGLYRTDTDCYRLMRFEQDSFFSDLASGAVPLSMKYWDSYGFLDEFPSSYRLPDIHNLRYLLPEFLAKELSGGLDRQFSSKIFTFRKTLYEHQLATAFRMNSLRLLGVNSLQTIVVPSVTTKEEVQYFKNMITGIIPEKHSPFFRFGVMIETAEALNDIAAIAPLCDSLCIGTNDLTAALTGLSRSVLDHSAWMKAHGYHGMSPFDVLVPEVIGPIAKGIARARAANPNIFINMCGHQTSGHCISSIDAVLAMGVDQITVLPFPENIGRARLALMRHAARQAMQGPEFSGCATKSSFLSPRPGG
jgi:hypothetical protein